jgi:hypothetical protein
MKELTYAEFLDRLSLPASRDIVDAIRRFIGSVLGPRGDGQYVTSSTECVRCILCLVLCILYKKQGYIIL